MIQNGGSIKNTEKLIKRAEMEGAIAAAEEALAVGEVPVGCVIVDGDGKILGTIIQNTSHSFALSTHCFIIYLLTHHPSFK